MRTHTHACAYGSRRAAEPICTLGASERAAGAEG